MKTQHLVIFGLVVLVLNACSGPPGPEPSRSRAPAPIAPLPDVSGARDSPEIPDSPHPDSALRVPVRPGGRGGGGSPEAATTPFAVARTSAGEVALFDAATGAVLATAPGSGLGGDVDLACDPWQHRVISFEGDPESQWGEIASHAIAGGAGTPTLGARQHQVWIDGIARVAASPSGIVVFEDGYGPRWRLLPTSGAASASVYAPRPVSLQLGPGGGGQFQIAALTHGQLGDSLDLRTAEILSGGVQTPGTTPLSVPLPAGSPSVQWASSPAWSHLTAASSGDVALSTLVDGAWTTFEPLGAGPGIAQVLQTVILPDDRIAMLTAGDTHLVVARLDDEGDVLCLATLALPAEPAGGSMFFSRALLAVGPSRLLAATPGGVFAVSVADSCPMTLALDPVFVGDALRDPLSGCEADQ